MKQLIIIRHASAEPEVYPKRDFDRNLEPLGIAEAEKLGRFILSKSEKPEKILCSSAIRTMQTAEHLAQILNLEVDAIRTSVKMYNAIISVLKEQITQFDGAESCLALLAHNPGISQLASYLGSADHFQLPTAGAVCFSFNIENWAEIKPASGKLLWYFSP